MPYRIDITCPPPNAVDVLVELGALDIENERTRLRSPLSLRVHETHLDRSHDLWGLGAAKTTFARKLERELPAIRFSQDEWVTRIVGNQHLGPEQMSEPVRYLVDCCWTRCVELGLDIVLDNGFWSRKERDETRSRAAALGAESRLYWLLVPDEIAWARIERRNRDLQGSWFIDRNAFTVLKTPRGFDPLGPDEPDILVRS